MIKNIIFDFGKVLVDYEWEPFIRSIIADADDRSRFMSIVCTQEYGDRCDLGVENFEDIIHEGQRLYPEWKEYFQEFMERQIDVMTGEIPGMRDLLSRLKAEGFMLYGLTNWSSTVYPVIEKYPILRMLDGRLVSSEEKMIKPDLRIYSRVCEKFNLKMDECLFTDDKIANVEGARKAGMKSVLFKDSEQFEKELRAILGKE